MKSNLTKSHCTTEAKRLANRFAECRGDVGRMSEVLYSHGANNRHVTETVDELLLKGKLPNPVAIRDAAERMRARGPKRCTLCGGTGYRTITKGQYSGAGPCECRQPQIKQGGLFA